MSDIKQIKGEIQKLSEIEKTVQSTNMKVTQMETKIHSLETKINEVELSCTFMSNEQDSQKAELKSTKAELTTLKKTCTNLESKTTQLEKEKKNIDSKLIELESRSMRENLLFFGVDEKELDCKAAFTKVCIETLNMGHDEVTDIKLDRIHRLGATATAGKQRPIVMKFHSYQDRETIRNKAWEKRDALKTNGYGIREQLPKTVMDKRKEMYPIMKAERDKGKTVKWNREKMLINGKEYVPPAAQSVPQ
ncbi:MAG: hypothetical protein ABW185_13435 [Sedimenticola sp.]